ncbi:MAG: MBL fold metallo-hydrolase [Candidatus Bathyarchaeia archaeon]
MTRLTFYGGVNEIGGNKILVQTEDGSVFLDFGRRLGYAHKYFAEFLQIRSKNALRDMLRLQVLPRIDGIYTPYLLDTTVLFERPEAREKVPVDQAPDFWKMTGISPCDTERPAVNAVFVSHAHFDHIQDVSFLDPSIPVYCTEKTKILAKAMTDVSMSGVDDQYYKLAKDISIKEKESNHKTLCPSEYECKENAEEEKPVIEDPKTKFMFTYEYSPKYRTFVTDSEGQINGIRYKMIPVGHSVPGACSILLTLPEGKRVLYTGDLRFHGDNEVSLDDYVGAIGGPVEVLITEGTRIDSEKVLTEKEITEKIGLDIEQAKGLVLINFGWKDLTRFNSIYEASRRNGRTLVICPKLAYLLYEMYCNFPEEYADPRTIANLKVYLKREGDMLYSKVDYENKYKMGYLHFHGRNSAKSDRNIVRIAERLNIGGDPANDRNPLPASCANEPYDYREIYDLATHHLDNGVRAYQIRRNPQQYVLMFTFWDANELFDLIPLDTQLETKYICATTEPFCEEMEIDESKMMNWFDYFKVSYDYEFTDEEKKQKMFVRSHVSGHASGTELKELIGKINPTKIIPIHTTNLKLFESLFPGRVILPEYAQPIEI